MVTYIKFKAIAFYQKGRTNFLILPTGWNIIYTYYKKENFIIMTKPPSHLFKKKLFFLNNYLAAGGGQIWPLTTTFANSNHLKKNIIGNGQGTGNVLKEKN